MTYRLFVFLVLASSILTAQNFQRIEVDELICKVIGSGKISKMQMTSEHNEIYFTTKNGFDLEDDYWDGFLGQQILNALVVSNCMA